MNEMIVECCDQCNTLVVDLTIGIMGS